MGTILYKTLKHLQHADAAAVYRMAKRLAPDDPVRFAKIVFDGLKDLGLTVPKNILKILGK
jgi:hypothetical protein